jgi:cell division inhibitor SepF
MFKNAMLYLGLGSDEDFEKLDQSGSAEEREGVRALDGGGREVLIEPPPEAAPGPVDPDAEPAHATVSAVRPIPVEQVPEQARRQSVVRTIPAPATAKPHIVSPISFNDAQEVADKFKLEQPVIVNLQQADDDLTRRLIDFASGLCYGVGGSMKKVADYVYLLTPADVEVSATERQLLQDQGLHD